MKIELRKIEYMSRLSQETHCYSADLYIDGKKAGTVSNEGHGGPDHQHLLPGYDIAAIDAYIATNYPPLTYGGRSFPMNLESLCGDLMNDFLARRDVKRALSTKIIARAEDGTFYEWTKKRKGQDITAKILAQIATQHPGYHVLNTMPEDKAVEMLRSGLKDAA